MAIVEPPAGAAGARGAGRTALLGSLLLIALSLAVYAPALPHQPLAIDRACLATSDAVTAETAWALRPPTWPWAPALRVSLAQDRTIWGDTPFGRRLHAVLTHTATAVLLFLALRGLGALTLHAWWASALFAVNPFVPAAIFWLGARDVALGTGLSAAALACYAALSGRPGLLRWFCWAAPAALAPLAHPAFAALPLVLLMLDARVVHRAATGIWREKLPVLAVAAAAVLMNTGGTPPALPPWSLVLDQPWRWARLAYPCALPAAGLAALVLTRRFPGHRAHGVIALALVLSVVITAIRLPAWRSDDARWNALLLRHPHHATAHLVLGHQHAAAGSPVVADRHYASMGPARAAWARAYADAGLWAAAARLAPDDPALRREVANEAWRQGDEDAAFSNYVAALRLDPRDAGALNGLGEVLLQRGQARDAADLFRASLAQRPDDPRVSSNLARAVAADTQPGN